MTETRTNAEPRPQVQKAPERSITIHLYLTVGATSASDLEVAEELFEALCEWEDLPASIDSVDMFGIDTSS